MVMIQHVEATAEGPVTKNMTGSYYQRHLLAACYLVYYECVYFMLLHLFNFRDKCSYY